MPNFSLKARQNRAEALAALAARRAAGEDRGAVPQIGFVHRPVENLFA